MDMNLTDIQDIRAELEEYYECAGIDGFNERVLSKMQDDEVLENYRQLCKDFLAEEKEIYDN